MHLRRATWLGLAFAWLALACEEEHGTTSSGGGDEGGASSSTGSATSGVTTTGTGGCEPVCPPSCPDTLPALGDPCGLEPEERCPYPREDCADTFCEARCIANYWITQCDACDGSTPDCPNEAPVHGAPCAQPTGDNPCFYDGCATDRDEFALGECDGQTWTTTYLLCHKPGCVDQESKVSCAANTVCPDHPACTTDFGAPNCEWNPCVHEPFSCDCVGYYCGPTQDCAEAKAGHVTCIAREPEEPQAVEWLADLPNAYNLRAGPSFLAFVGDTSVHILQKPLMDVVQVDGGFDPQHTYVDVEDELTFYTVGNQIRQYDAATGEAEVFASAPGLYGMVVNAEYLYWIEDSGSLKTLHRLPIPGGDPTIFTATPFVGLVDAELGWIYDVGSRSSETPPHQPVSIVADAWGPSDLRLPRGASHVYFSGQFSPAEGGRPIMRCPYSEVGCETIVTGQEAISSMAVSNEHVYWRDGVHRLWRSGLAGESPTILLYEVYGAYLTVDEGYIYWAGAYECDQGVFRIPLP